MRWLDGIIDLMDMNLSKLQETLRTGKPGILHPWGRKDPNAIYQLNNNN